MLGKLRKLLFDVADVVLVLVEKELSAVFAGLREFARGEALLSVLGDFGGTFGGTSSTSPRLIMRVGTDFGLASAVEGITNGFNALDSSSSDRLSTSFLGGWSGLKRVPVTPLFLL